MYSNELVEIMKDFLDSIEAEYAFKENVFRCDTILNDKIKNLCFIISLEEYGYLISGIPEDVTVTDSKLTELLEYINMVNVETIGPTIEVWEDIVMCSYSLNCRGMFPNAEQIHDAFAMIILCLEKFGGGLLDVLDGTGTPQEVFEKCMEVDADGE